MRKARSFEISLVLLLIVCVGLLYYMIVILGAPQVTKGWEAPANGSIDYMFLGSNDTLYVFQGNQISAILPDGSLKWKYTAPGNYQLINRWTYPTYTLMNGNRVHSNQPYPVVEENNGSLYVYAFLSLNLEETNNISRGSSINHTSVIFALSQEGTVEWEYPMTSQIIAEDYDSGSALNPLLLNIVTIDSSEGRLLVYHDHEESILADNGTLLFNLSNLTGPVAVDENGGIYGVKTALSYGHVSHIEENGISVRVWNAFEVSASGEVSHGGYEVITNTEVEIVTVDESNNLTDRLTGIAYRCPGRVIVYHDGKVEDWKNCTLLGSYPQDRPQVVAYETGEIYAVKAVVSIEDSLTIYREAAPLKGFREASVVSSGTVEAFDMRGRLLWSTDLCEPVEQPSTIESVWKQYDSLPLYRNGTLYTFISNGVAALDTAGNVMWVQHLVGSSYTPFSLMPIDSAGNTYLQRINDRLPQEYVSSISPGGQVFPDAWTYKTIYYVYGRTDTGISSGLSAVNDMTSEPLPVSGGDGVIYAIGRIVVPDNTSFASLIKQQHIPSDTVTAYDIKTGRVIWNFTIPSRDRQVVILCPDNLNMTDRSTIYESVQMMSLDPETGQKASLSRWTLADKSGITVCPSTNVTYIYYDYLVYDAGTNSVFQQPNLTGNLGSCAKGLYAIDSQGRLLWEKQVNGSIDMLVADNSTIYYSTSDGRLGGIGVNLAAGITVIAIAYLFLRFFLIGAVSRAKSRLDKNENRNAVLKYIAASPGATLADVVRELGINPGTARYHLLVLSLNHRIASHQDTKFIRYFPKTSVYGDQERSLLSLVRRKPLARMLSTLAIMPGLSNKELSRELQLSAAATHEQVSELVGRGVLIKTPKPDGEYAYSIKDEYEEAIKRAIEQS